MVTRNPQFIQRPRAAARGFTIAELVIAFIIIGVLVLIMVPALQKRTLEARQEACREELKRLADAQDQVFINLGYLVRPYVLNDDTATEENGGDGIANASPNDLIEGILDNTADATDQIYDDPSQFFINAHTQDFSDDAIQNRLFDQLRNTIENNTDELTWGGPFVQWTRDANNNDWPDDPWGNDYLFFTKNGVLYPPPGFGVTGEDFSFTFNTTYGEDAVDAELIFSRPTFLSLGPNGVPGASEGAGAGIFGEGDDLYREFGTNF